MNGRRHALGRADRELGQAHCFGNGDALTQTTVERRQLGTATSTLTFSRSIGGTIGVSIMGAVLSTRLISNLAASGLSLDLVTQLLDRAPGAEAVISDAARLAVANAINIVFVIAFIAAFLALVVTLFSPRHELRDRAPEKEPVTISAD